MHKLTICIPTYNRSEKVIKQCDFLKNELRNISINVEVLIRDNNSDDCHKEKLTKYFETSSFIFNQNNENVGIVGNMYKLLLDSRGEYIWFIGDDDQLHSGILAKVYQRLNKSLTFVNHRAVDIKGNILMEEAFNKENTASLNHVFRYSLTTMMFLSACIYNKKDLTTVFNIIGEKNIINSTNYYSLPFKASLYCEREGGVEYIYEILIDNLWGDASWSDVNRDMFLRQIPRDLLVSLFESNDKANIMRSLLFYFKLKYKALIKFWLLRLIGK